MSNIYPPELTLKQTTESDPKLSYLDSICHGKFVTVVYDKRDNFNFVHIVNYPFTCSNNYSKAYIRSVHFRVVGKNYRLVRQVALSAPWGVWGMLPGNIFVF